MNALELYFYQERSLIPLNDSDNSDVANADADYYYKLLGAKFSDKKTAQATGTLISKWGQQFDQKFELLSGLHSDCSPDQAIPELRIPLPEDYYNASIIAVLFLDRLKKNKFLDYLGKERCQYQVERVLSGNGYDEFKFSYFEYSLKNPFKKLCFGSAHIDSDGRFKLEFAVIFNFVSRSAVCIDIRELPFVLSVMLYFDPRGLDYNDIFCRYENMDVFKTVCKFLEKLVKDDKKRVNILNKTEHHDFLIQLLHGKTDSTDAYMDLYDEFNLEISWWQKSKSLVLLILMSVFVLVHGTQIIYQKTVQFLESRSSSELDLSQLESNPSFLDSDEGSLIDHYDDDDNYGPALRGSTSLGGVDNRFVSENGKEFADMNVSAVTSEVQDELTVSEIDGEESRILAAEIDGTSGEEDADSSSERGDEPVASEVEGEESRILAVEPELTSGEEDSDRALPESEEESVVSDVKEEDLRIMALEPEETSGDEDTGASSMNLEETDASDVKAQRRSGQFRRNFGENRTRFGETSEKTGSASEKHRRKPVQLWRNFGENRFSFGETSEKTGSASEKLRSNLSQLRKTGALRWANPVKSLLSQYGNPDRKQLRFSSDRPCKHRKDIAPERV